MSDFAVVIPVYKECLKGAEEQSIYNTLQKLAGSTFVLVAPENMNLEWYQSIGKFEVARFQDCFFKSEQTYSKLLQKEKFYYAFSSYKYILIVQTDVWIVGDFMQLNEFICMNYDYIGAPWKDGVTAYAYTMRGISYWPKMISRPNTVYVGNGGLSLRNVQKHIELLQKYRLQSRIWKKVGEDIFFSYYGNKMRSFNIAPIDVAEKFSLETSAREDISNGIIPFGIHAWMKYVPEIGNLCNENM